MKKSDCLGEVGVDMRVVRKWVLRFPIMGLELPLFRMVQEWYLLGRGWTYIFHKKRQFLD